MNPANSTKPEKKERTRVPMSVPQQKLAVPEIPGYYCHWMLGSQRVQQALKAGYEFVDEEETDITSTGLADDATGNGNTDLGSRVSLLAGLDVGSDGKEQRLYLMKIKNEWREEDLRALEERSEVTAAALRCGLIDSDNPNGIDHRYIPDQHKQQVASLFTPKHRRP